MSKQASFGQPAIYNATPPTLTDGDSVGLNVDSAGNLKTAGSIASGSTDSGSPVKTGGVYRSTLPTVTDGQRVDTQATSRGLTLVSLGDLIAGEDLTANLLKVENRYSYTNIASATTTTVKSGAGFLHAITINTTAAGATTVYDNTAASGNKIATLKASIVEQTFTFNVSFTTGLTIVTAAASDVTVSYR